MHIRISDIVIAASLWVSPGLPFTYVQAAEAGDVREHAAQSFDRLSQHTDRQASHKPTGHSASMVEIAGDGHSPDHYWIGRGQGDLNKGKAVCQRVSELSARTDLAKQIRVLVKEHLVDRVRERSGRETEQDIELTREEIVQEYLQGATIVDRKVDEVNKTCYATAVMRKALSLQKQPPESDASSVSAK